MVFHESLLLLCSLIHSDYDFILLHYIIVYSSSDSKFSFTDDLELRNDMVCL